MPLTQLRCLCNKRVNILGGTPFSTCHIDGQYIPAIGNERPGEAGNAAGIGGLVRHDLHRKGCQRLREDGHPEGHIAGSVKRQVVAFDHDPIRRRVLGCGGIMTRDHVHLLVAGQVGSGLGRQGNGFHGLSRHNAREGFQGNQPMGDHPVPNQQDRLRGAGIILADGMTEHNVGIRVKAVRKRGLGRWHRNDGRGSIRHGSTTRKSRIDAIKNVFSLSVTLKKTTDSECGNSAFLRQDRFIRGIQFRITGGVTLRILPNIFHGVTDPDPVRSIPKDGFRVVVPIGARPLLFCRLRTLRDKG